jgi:hypothetical protein
MATSASFALNDTTPTLIFSGTGTVWFFAQGGCLIGPSGVTQSTGTAPPLGQPMQVINESIYGLASGTGNASVINVASVVSAPASATTPTVSTVAASVTSVSLLASNTARRSFVNFNDSTTATLRLGRGTAATSTSAIVIGPGQLYEAVQPCYTGAINGIWNSAIGNARIEEIT